MAKTKRPQGSSPAATPAAADTAAARPRPPGGRDPRPWIYGVLSLLMAAVQAYVMIKVTPNRHAWAQTLLLAIPTFTAAMGIATIAGALLRARGARAAWIAAVAGGAITLIVTVIVLSLLLASAAFLAGVYGSFGKGASFGVLGAAALIVELVAILPALQLKYLLTRAGRRAFGLPPLWKGPARAAAA